MVPASLPMLPPTIEMHYMNMNQMMESALCFSSFQVHAKQVLLTTPHQ